MTDQSRVAAEVVEKLNDFWPEGFDVGDVSTICTEASSCIAALEAENARLKEDWAKWKRIADEYCVLLQNAGSRMEDALAERDAVLAKVEMARREIFDHVEQAFIDYIACSADTPEIRDMQDWVRKYRKEYDETHPNNTRNLPPASTEKQE